MIKLLCFLAKYIHLEAKNSENSEAKSHWFPCRVTVWIFFVDTPLPTIAWSKPGKNGLIMPYCTFCGEKCCGTSGRFCHVGRTLGSAGKIRNTWDHPNECSTHQAGEVTARSWKVNVYKIQAVYPKIPGFLRLLRMSLSELVSWPVPAGKKHGNDFSVHNSINHCGPSTHRYYDSFELNLVGIQ